MVSKKKLKIKSGEERDEGEFIGPNPDHEVMNVFFRKTTNTCDSYRTIENMNKVQPIYSRGRGII